MGEDASPLGYIWVPHFYDGADVQYVGPGAGHRLPVDVEAAVLPTDAATQTTLALCLAELEDVIKHANLNIKPITKNQGVDVEAAVPPVPALPICQPGAVNVGTGSWTTVATYTVTTGKTLYVYYWSAAPSANPAGFVFLCRISVAGTVQDSGAAVAGDSQNTTFPVPLVATSEQTVVVQVYHAEATAEWCRATVVGFEV